MLASSKGISRVVPAGIVWLPETVPSFSRTMVLTLPAAAYAPASVKLSNLAAPTPKTAVVLDINFGTSVISADALKVYCVS